MYFYQYSIYYWQKKLKTNFKTGLKTTEILRRQKKFGLNNLNFNSRTLSWWFIFFSQFKSPLIYILLVAGFINLILQDFTGAIVIFFTVVFNAIIGFIQEYKADKTLSEIKNLLTYKSLVVRDNQIQEIDSQYLVPGDILLLQAGDKIMADARLLEVKNFTVDESALTGESQPVKKTSAKLKSKKMLAEISNFVFSGSSVLSGQARAVVVKTGLKTQIGNLANLVQQTNKELTPLQKQLNALAKLLSWIVLFLSLLIIIFGWFETDLNLFTLFETAVAVAVAAIPESLIISLTVILAIGMKRILKKKAIVRKLITAETLGAVKVICLDKTGTLTEGKIGLDSLVVYQKKIKVSKHNLHSKILLKAMQIGLLANSGLLTNYFQLDKIDNLDLAFIKQKDALNLDINKDKVFDFQPFNSQTKMHLALVDNYLYCKGAPEKIIALSKKILLPNGQIFKFNSAQKTWFKKQLLRYSQQGWRILALAYKPETSKKITKNILESGLIFVGLVLLRDNLRQDLRQTWQKIQQAGIKLVMVTGDYVGTAKYIWQKIGLVANKSTIMTGYDLDKINLDELKHKVNKINIFARVSPEQKINIVKAWQANGYSVAMTGDGVNDAPALKLANIGISLGSGTEVAKETADLILLDDNLKTIVLAIEEGRRIYQNIRKTILYLLSDALTEVFIVLGAIILKLPLPVLATQILWVNFIEDTLPAIALAFDKSDKNLLSDKPEEYTKKIINSEMKWMIILISLIMNSLLFGLYYYLYQTQFLSLEKIRTIIFASLSFDSLLMVFSIRNLRQSIWQINFFSNKYLLLAVGVSLFLLIISIYNSFLQKILNTVYLDWEGWLIVIVFGLLNIILLELIKRIYQSFNKN